MRAVTGGLGGLYNKGCVVHSRQSCVVQEIRVLGGFLAGAECMLVHQA